MMTVSKMALINKEKNTLLNNKMSIVGRCNGVKGVLITYRIDSALHRNFSV